MVVFAVSSAATAGVLGLGSSLVFLTAMVGTFAFLWFFGQPAQLRRTAEGRHGSRWLTRGRSVDEDVDHMRSVMRIFVLPFAGLCVVVALATFVGALVRDI